MHSKQSLSLIIPAYNKDTEVFLAISSYVEKLKHLPYDWEIIVVDDASRDKTLREAVRSKAFNGNTERIKILSYNLNQGKGFALYYGFKKSQGNIVVFADADLDLPSDNLPEILKTFIKNRADIAIGSKRHPLSLVHYPFFRRIMSRTYQLLVKSLFNLNVSDTQVGLKAFKRDVLINSFPRIVVKNFAFDLEVLVVAKLLGYRKIIEAPIILKYNFSSTIKIRSIVQVLQDTIGIFYRKFVLRYYDIAHNRLEHDESNLPLSLQKSFI